LLAEVLPQAEALLLTEVRPQAVALLLTEVRPQAVAVTESGESSLPYHRHPCRHRQQA
jgi:hypothetical protein